MRPPKLAIRGAVAGFAAAAILVLGAASASAAPNPGYGTSGSTVVPQQYGTGATGAVYNTSPQFPTDKFADGPQTANIPTLAWVGEEVRLVACDKAIQVTPLSGLGNDSSDHNPGLRFQSGVWSIENWTGDQAFAATPTFDGSESTNLYLTNTGGTSFFAPNGYSGTQIDKGCVSANIKSLHAGLSIVKLDVNEQNVSLDGDQFPDLDPTVVYSQQFVVIWMVPNSPVISESSVSTQAAGINSLSNPGTPGTDAPPTTFPQLTALGVTNATGLCPAPSTATNCSGFLGDPSGNGVFNPSFWSVYSGVNINQEANQTPATNNGLINIRVKGTFPIEDAPYYNQSTPGTNVQYFGQTSFTMPDDWAKLAGIMATSNITNMGTDPTVWDIHGGPTNPSQPHTNAGTPPGQLASVCINTNNTFTALTDPVDSCANNGLGVGNPYAFSRVFGDVTNGPGGTVGPFDPQAPNETLLSDRRLNSDDAPMPALPVTVSIAPNVAGGTGGVGGLYGVSKYLIYSHDFNGGGPSTSVGPTPTSALTSTGTGNLYNPFYSTYIPSTSRPINEASGITGVYNEHHYVVDGSSGNDFPGFSNGDTDAYKYWTALEAASNDTGAATKCLRRLHPDQGTPQYYLTPDQPTSVLVYTDERGEAYVDYNPGTGFYFDALVTPDGNGACDLQNVGTLGTSAISAQANYPYQSPVYRTPAASNILTKTVKSLWSKSITCVPKAPGSGPQINADFCTATAIDINGQPFANEEVCFSIQNTDGSAFGGLVLYKGEEVHSVPACEWTDSTGSVTIELAGSVGNNLDVQAYFDDEHIFRDATNVTLGSGPPVTSTAPPTVLPDAPVVATTTSVGGSGAGGSSSGGSSSGNTSAPAGGSTSVTTPLSVAKGSGCTVKSIHLRANKRSVKLSLSCLSAKSDSVIIKTYRNGKLIHSYKATVKAGKTVILTLGSKKVSRVTAVAA